jgi:Na+/H+ antiporter NhaD/arsenite permease-like protein
MYYTALIIFIITYIGIIFTRLPKMNIDRPSAAFFGAVAMIVTGVLPFDEAIRSIDFNTITLLLGMMIIIATLELDGFFSFIASRALSFSDTPTRLLIILTLVTGIASAFLVNDAVVLLFTPVIILICRSTRLNPIPFLIAEILASNVGSAMTITGNPQNMLIGINSGISYSHFLLSLLPISLAGLIIIILVIRWVYPKDFGPQKLVVTKPEPTIQDKEMGSQFIYNYQSMMISVPIFFFVILMFFFGKQIGLGIPVIALLGGSLILIFGRIKPSKIIRQVDWVLLLFFASLFIVVHGIEKVGLMDRLISSVSLKPDIAGLSGIHAISLVLSQIVSNVPFTVLMLPLMKTAHNEFLWLALASASTLAGNATIIGAMANLIVIESAERHGIKIGFREFFKSGIIVTLLTMALSFGILYLRMVV